MKSPKTKNSELKQSELKNYVDFYLQDLALSRALSTVKCYERDVTGWLGYVQKRGVKRAVSIKSEYIVGYLSGLNKEGYSEASISRVYSSICSFCKYLRRTKAVKNNITEEVQAPRNNQKAPKVLTRDEMQQILQQPNVETENGCRDRAMLELLYSSGLRASELCDLDYGDVQPGSVRVRKGKRDKTRTIPMTEEATTRIWDYIIQWRGHEDGALFVTLKDKRIRREVLCWLVSQYAEKVGIQGVSTHTFRHACATHLLEAGADLLLIQKVLGHECIRTTQRYTHLSSKAMNTMFQTFHPSNSNAV